MMNLNEQARRVAAVLGIDVGSAAEGLTALRADGWTLLRTESVRRAQERQRLAEWRATIADEQTEATRRWAIDCRNDERRSRDRLTFVYGVARAQGATEEDLRQPQDGDWIHVCSICYVGSDILGIHHGATVSNGPEDADVMCLWMTCRHPVDHARPYCVACNPEQAQEPF